MKMMYRQSKEFTKKDLEDLFLSVDWSSGHYPDKLVVAMKNSATVLSAWDGGKLVGLANALDDGIMTAYVHYVLVHPDYQGAGIGKALLTQMREIYKDYLRIVLVSYNSEIGFYEGLGFVESKECAPMMLTSLWT